eukprot:Colp12_sorted_trinity150504_noHs@30295
MSSGVGMKKLVLAIGMLVTGTCNTIMTKWQDRTEAEGDNGVSEEFNHPAFQTYTMFIGEVLCLFVFYINRYRERKNNQEAYEKLGPAPQSNFPAWIFLLPTICDLTATTLMNVGLLFTNASVYQMLRGAMVIFTAMFSVIFLKRRLRLQHYLGLFFVVSGIAIVGLSSVLFESSGEASKDPVLGNILVLVAQVVVATQFVVEEKLIGKYEVPALQAVGWEGLWGVVIITIALPALQHINIGGKPIEDTVQALYQMKNSWQLIVAVLGSVFSISFFNFFGISVTKFLSATHRTTIDSCRTLFIWIVTLILGWESFVWLQLVGFFVLVLGTFTYNEVFKFPGILLLEVKLATICPCLRPQVDLAEAERLLKDEENNGERYNATEGTSA